MMFLVKMFLAVVVSVWVGYWVLALTGNNKTALIFMGGTAGACGALSARQDRNRRV
jgi:hypothetical protein